MGFMMVALRQHLPRPFNSAMEVHCANYFQMVLLRRVFSSSLAQPTFPICPNKKLATSRNRGALLERFGRLDEAVACFDAIDTIRPDNSSNLFNKGSVLQKLGRHKEALAVYEEAARRGPPDAETELNRGNVLQKARAPRRSARCL